MPQAIVWRIPWRIAGDRGSDEQQGLNAPMNTIQGAHAAASWNNCRSLASDSPVSKFEFESVVSRTRFETHALITQSLASAHK